MGCGRCVNACSVGTGQVGRGDFCLAVRNAVTGRQLEYQVAGDAGQHLVVLGWRDQHAVLDDEDIAGRALRGLAVLDEDRLHRTGIDRLLAQRGGENA